MEIVILLTRWKNFKLDKKGVKILTEALSSMEVDGNHSFLYLDSCELERKILEISYNYLPAVVIPFITHADTNEMRNCIVEDAQKIAFRYEDENFTILIPTTADEFKKEADYQQNCVFRLYYPRVKDCSTHVVFIRKKSDINTPYITCEVSNCGDIIQYLARFNRDVAKAFKVAYQKFLHEHF